MDEKTLRALVEAGALKRIRIIGDGAFFHVEADTATATIAALTTKGTPKVWRSLDAAAKWTRGLGVGTAQLELAKWQPRQGGMRL